jgi:hypothetical protein
MPTAAIQCGLQWKPSGTIDLVVLMIDGVVIDAHMLLVALGIDVDGNKHVLGVREGATL